MLSTNTVTCVLATGRAEGGRAVLGVLDAAVARWAAAEQGTLALRPVGMTMPCEGLPPVEEVVLPNGGWAVGLRRPAVRASADGPAVAKMGEDGRWWHVQPWEGVGTGGIAFEHESGPPTRLRARMDPQREPPEGLVVHVPLHGVAVTDLEEAPSYAAVVQGDLATVIPVGERLLVLGEAAGVAEGVIREGERAPRSLEVVIGAEPPPTAEDVAVRAGGRRWLKADKDLVEAWSAEPDVVTVELRGRRIALHGGHPGRAQVALKDAAGDVYVLTVAVGR